jgi:hypothetical protein
MFPMLESTEPLIDDWTLKIFQKQADISLLVTNGSER